MKKLLILSSALLLCGCASIKQLWPKPHDPEMFGNLVELHINVDHVNCKQPNWSPALAVSQRLAIYSQWRNDPQAENLMGLQHHIEKMNQGGSVVFCELGKKTALLRIDAARTAWSGR